MSSYPSEKMHLTTSEIDGVSAELDNSIELDELSVGDILFTLTCKNVHWTDDF